MNEEELEILFWAHVVKLSEYHKSYPTLGYSEDTIKGGLLKKLLNYGQRLSEKASNN